VERFELLAREVDVELRRHADRLRLALLERDVEHAAAIQVVHLFAVGGEVRAPLRAGRRRELPRDRRLLRELVDRVDVEVLLAGG
jgi:hypothetical protein